MYLFCSAAIVIYIYFVCCNGIIIAALDAAFLFRWLEQEETEEWGEEVNVEESEEGEGEGEGKKGNKATERKKNKKQPITTKQNGCIPTRTLFS